MEGKKSLFDKYYFLLLAIPIILLIFSLFYLNYFYNQNNDIFYKDVSLSGGTTITITGDIDSTKLESSLKTIYQDIVFRKLTDLRTGENLALIIESSAQPTELKESIEEILGYPLTEDNSSTEFTGPTLGGSFYSELLRIIFISFILMALVIFIIFGEVKSSKAAAMALSLSAVKFTFPSSTLINMLIILIGLFALGYGFFNSKTKKDYIYLALGILAILVSFIFNQYYLIFVVSVILLLIYILESVPSIAVIFAAFADIVMTVAVVDLMGIKISSAGIAAFLMLIGYSVDTDILLTTRALKRGEGTLNSRIFSSFKTGILMTLTALAAVLPAFFIVSGLPDSFRQIFLILAIGLSADILNTWLTNVGLIKWYCQRKGVY